MTFIDRPLPEGLELPTLREKRVANLKHEGRIPGSINRISKDLKNGVLNGAIAYGCDGQGTGGLDGYLYMCAAKFPKAYLHLLGKLLPMQVQGDGIPRPGITLNVVSVDSGSYLSPEDIAKLREQPALIEHAPEIEARSPEEARLLSELESLSVEELTERAAQAGVSLVDQS
jgi:hypothetical protein